MHPAHKRRWSDPVFFIKNFDLNPLIREVKQHIGGKFIAEAIQYHPDFDAALCGIDQHFEVGKTDFITFYDVGAEQDFFPGIPQQIIPHGERAVLVAQYTEKIAFLLCYKMVKPKSQQKSEEEAHDFLLKGKKKSKRQTGVISNFGGKRMRSSQIYVLYNTRVE